MKSNRVIVAGAGASGLMAAACAAEAGAEVVVIDGNDRAGRKLYATGNGRCNFTNARCDGSAISIADNFGTHDMEFAGRVLEKFSADDCIEFFRKNGVPARRESDGRCYPYSGQAAAVVNALERKCASEGAVLVTGDRITGITATSDVFDITCESGRRFTCDAVIIACGGRAGLRFGSTGDGYGFAKNFGHSLIPPRPALVAAESEDSFIKELKGVRAQARVTLTLGADTIAAETGEVQFTGTGISGICVFDLSRHMEAPRPSGRKNKKKKHAGHEPAPVTSPKHYVITADFVPGIGKNELIKYISQITGIKDTGEEITVNTEKLADLLSGTVNRKLAAAAVRMAAGSGRRADRESTDGAKSADVIISGHTILKRCAELLKEFSVSVSSTKGWDDAQTTCGGVDCSQVNSANMESLYQPGLFFCGEVLDVDGRCGGYNLHWAWASGRLAGIGAAEYVAEHAADSAEQQKNSKTER